jgi:hypothetical protein
MSKAIKRKPEPLPWEDDYVDPATSRQPWKECRKWEAGPKPSDIFKADPDKQIVSE